MNATQEQIAQFYRAHEMVNIYHVSENTFYGKENRQEFRLKNGMLVPAVADLPSAARRWRKRDVWACLGVSDGGGVDMKLGDVVRASRAAELLTISSETVNAMIRESKIPALNLGREHVIPIQTIAEMIGGTPRIWPKTEDDPAYMVHVPSRTVAARTEPLDAPPANPDHATDISWSDLRRIINEEVVKCIRVAEHEGIFPGPNRLRQTIQSAIDETWMGRTVEVVINEGTIAAIRNVVSEEVGRLQTSGVVEAVLSDQDVTRVAEAARNAVRETLIVRNTDLTPPPMPPTTALRDRVRGVAPMPSNGR